MTFQKDVVAHFVGRAPSAKESSASSTSSSGATTSANPSGPAASTINNAAKVYIVGSTFYANNLGTTTTHGIWFNAGAGIVTNTAVWNDTAGTNVASNTGAGATLTTNYCFVKGQTLTGTGNLAGTTDPKLRSDLHIPWDSPLRAAGGAVTQSRVDMDGEARPATSPDIGADQFVDTDGDQLADWWEVAETGNLTTLTTRSQDSDGDGLPNDLEYDASSNPTVADTDGDGLPDGAEITDGTNPLATDTDGDGMPDGWEVTNGISPVISNAYDDNDGDRFPNVFEYAKSTNPSDHTSIPTPSFIVDASGGGTHTTISAAMNATSLSNGPYDIIGIAPGTYTGLENNRDVKLTTAKPKLLLIGLEGAAKTIVQGDLTGFGWLIENDAVVSSLTFQKDIVAHYVDVPSGEVRFVDLIVRNNVGLSEWAGGIHVNNAAKVYIVGSTFTNNLGTTTTHGIWFNAGAGIVTNTAVWNDTAGTNVASNTGVGATLTTNYCFVKGSNAHRHGESRGHNGSQAPIRPPSPLEFAAPRGWRHRHAVSHRPRRRAPTGNEPRHRRRSVRGYGWR